MVEIDEKKIEIKRIAAVFLLLWCFLSATALATEMKQAYQHEIIFLLDASNSMNTVDPNRLVIDGIKQMIAGLPADYTAGLVVYDSGLQSVVGLHTDHKQLMASVGQVQYTGYTNAGAGLAKALELFSKTPNRERSIVLLSDGEIMLDSEPSTKESLDKFNRAVQEAQQQGIQIRTIALGGRENVPPVNIYYSAAGNGQKIYEATTSESISQIAKQIVFSDLGVQKSSVATGDSGNGSIQVKLPTTDADSVKILLTSSWPLSKITADYNALSGEIIAGERFAIIEVVQPQLQEVSVHFAAANGNTIHADLIPQMQAKLKTEVSSPDGNANLVEIKVIPVSMKNESVLLLRDPYFENKTIPVFVDGQPITAKIQNGAAVFTIDKPNKLTVEISPDFSGLNMNLAAPSQISVIMQQRDWMPVISSITVAALLAITFIFMRRRKKMTPEPLPSPMLSRYEFAGKLNIYITKSPDDSDIAPQIYNLYRQFSKEEISLGMIMEKCGIKNSFSGAYKIIFSPGANKALVVTNKSDCTILKSRDLLIKDHSCLLYFDERLYVTFEDESSEMVLYYKNVKPSDK